MNSRFFAGVGFVLAGFLSLWAQGAASGVATSTTTEGQTTIEAGAAASGSAAGTSFLASAGSVTVGNEQWTRLAFGIDAPIWRFGVGFDVELFFDQNGNLSDKGWDFKDKPLEAVTRKIRYIRYGHEEDPLFIKVGGLSDVTLGYGFIVDRFTNMLHYPDQKQLGVQINVNRMSSLDASIQLMLSDAQELRSAYDGGVVAARFALQPLKLTSLPLLSSLKAGVTYAVDRNVYAPARDWQPSGEEGLISGLQDSGLLGHDSVGNRVRNVLGDNGYNPDSMLQRLAEEDSAKNRVRSFGIYGLDLSMPIISGPPLSLDLYGQSGTRDDGVKGWGFGAPGLALKVWRLNAAIEYRHTEGRFEPGFFGPYYLDERLVRDPRIVAKADSLPSGDRNGIFGRTGFDFSNFLCISGAYQYMAGQGGSDKDQRFEGTAALGSAIISHIPRVKKLEAYVYKTNIGSDITRYNSSGIPILNASGSPTYDRFFEHTPDMYYGYRLGFEIAQGATLVWDSRFGFTRDGSGNLTPDNFLIVQTVFAF